MSMQLQEQLQAKTTRYLLLLLPLVLTVQLFPFVLNSLSSQQKTLFTPIDESTCFSLVELHDLIRAFRTFYSEPLNKVGTIYSNLGTCKGLKSQAFAKKITLKIPEVISKSWAFGFQITSFLRQIQTFSFQISIHQLATFNFSIVHFNFYQDLLKI